MKILVLFGAGLWGEDCYKNYKFKNLFDKIVFCDSNKRGKYIDDKEIISIKEMCDLLEKEKIYIIITSSYYQDIYDQLVDLKIENNVFGIYDYNTKEVEEFPKNWSKQTYSQDAEDVLLREYFYNKSGGVYIDIGAHHPYRFSNTYWAYKLGWRGVNIEPDKERFELFKKYRKEDININCGIANNNMPMRYYIYEEKAYNTFNPNMYPNKKILRTEEVWVKKLADVLEENKITKIDFMNIDVEGLEMEVLKSNDWTKWKPEYLLVEQCLEIDELIKSEIYLYLKALGYKCLDKVNRTAIYKIQ